MTNLLEKIDAQIADLETDVAKERAIIAAAIAAKQIGEHYWQKRDRFERKLITLRAVRDAAAEVLR